MKNKNHSLKNTCKNIILVILVLLLGVLTLLSWDVGVSIGDSRENASPLSLLRGWLPAVDGGYVQRAGETPAAYPVRMAVTTESGLIGAAYQESLVNTLYETAQPLLADAFSNAQEFSETSEEIFLSALQKDTLLVSYAGQIPLSLLSSWYGSKSNQFGNLCAGSILLTKDGELFVREPVQGKLFLAKTQVDSSVWDKAFASVTASACNYAGLLEEPSYQSFYPETPILQDVQAFDIYQSYAPDFWESGAGENLQNLLTAFGYDPALSSYAEEDTGTQVFVENYNTLRVGKNGTVQFKSTALTDGLSAYQDGEAEGMNALAAQVDFAQKLLSSILGASPDMLQSIEQDTENNITRLYFTQTIGGIPVHTEGAPFASFTFTEGVLASAELNLHIYSPIGKKLYILPAVQAAAAAQNAKNNYVIAYQSAENGRMLPKAFLK